MIVLTCHVDGLLVMESFIEELQKTFENKKHKVGKTPIKYPGRTLRQTKTCFEFSVGPEYLSEMLQEFQMENLKGEHAQVGQVR